jgi:hypothetical protein
MDSANGTVPHDTGEGLTCISRPNMVPNALQIPVQPPSGHTIDPSTFPGKSCHSRHLGDIEPCQNEMLSCSVKENISNWWTVPPALSPDQQVTDSPISPDLMHPHTCYEPSYSPQVAISLTLPWIHEDPSWWHQAFPEWRTRLFWKERCQ